MASPAKGCFGGLREQRRSQALRRYRISLGLQSRNARARSNRAREAGVKVFRLVCCAAGMIALSSEAAAHGGGLNSAGCHNNRKTGDYHCHRSSSAPTTAQPPSAPVATVPRTDLGAGYPAPTSSTPMPHASVDLVFAAQQLLIRVG